MNTNEAKKKKFKSIARGNMIASMKLEGISVVKATGRVLGIDELKSKYASEVQIKAKG